MLSFVNKYAKNIYASQNGEEGILIECCKRLGIVKGHSVEAGGANGLFCSNSALLLKDHQWSGLFVEVSYDLHQQSKANWIDRPDVRHQCSKVDEKNINAFVDERCDLVSLDTDGSDYRIFEGMTAKPKIVIVEIDSRIPPDVDEFSAQGGSGFRPMVQLGISKGYFLLCHVGNLIFVDRQYKELFPEIDADPLEYPEAYFLDAILTGDRSYLANV